MSPVWSILPRLTLRDRVAGARAHSLSPVLWRVRGVRRLERRHRGRRPRREAADTKDQTARHVTIVISCTAGIANLSKPESTVPRGLGIRRRYLRGSPTGFPPLPGPPPGRPPQPG